MLRFYIYFNHEIPKEFSFKYFYGLHEYIISKQTNLSHYKTHSKEYEHILFHFKQHHIYYFKFKDSNNVIHSFPILSIENLCEFCTAFIDIF